MLNIRPLCILDFYVSENCQREGHGKHLYDCILEDQNIKPHMLAYDRPSHKFLSFLRKHFSLCDYFPQSNNFVVFKEYFDEVNGQAAVKKQARDEYSTMSRKYFNPYDSYSKEPYNIREKQRQGQGVFSALGSHIMQRTDSVKRERQPYSAYEKFQCKFNGRLGVE
jgi:alpha-tubulin N-acetyltransferase 1